MLINQKKPTGLPYGSGSLQIRGRVWWMIFKNETGLIIQESAKTQDWDEAVRLLAARALPIAQARVAALEKVAYEAPGKGSRTARRDSRGRTGAGIAEGRNRSRAVPARGSSAAGTGGRK
jgi:hypothetical protein